MAILLDYYPNETEVSNAVWGVVAFGTREGTEIAQSFTPSANWTGESVRVQLSKQGTPTDNAVIGIQADSGGAPSGTFLGSGTIAGSSITSGATQSYTITFSSAVSLTNGTLYWLVFDRDGANSDANNYYLTQNADAAYAGNPMYNRGGWTTNGGGSASDAYDFKFELNGTIITAIKPQSNLLLLGIG